MQTFGDLIKAQRIVRGLTLEALAKKTGTHKGYCSGIEHSHVNPPAAGMTMRLCRELGLEVEYMLLLAWAEKAPKQVRKIALDFVGSRHVSKDPSERRTA